MSTGIRLDRRTVVAGLAALPVIRAVPAIAQTGGLPSALAYDITYRSKSVGHHRVAIAAEGDQTRVTHDLAIKVTLLGISLYSLQQNSTELWADDRLVRLNSTSVKRGKKVELRGEASGDGFALTGPDGTRTIASSIATTNALWRAKMLERSELLDTSDGSVLPRKLDPLGQDIALNKYQLDFGDTQMVAWFDAALLAKADVTQDGNTIRYVRT